MTATCIDCAHWRFARQGNSRKVGECRARAPQATTSGGPVHDAQWPKTLETDGCGEHRPATTREASAEGAAQALAAATKTETARPSGRVARKTTKGGVSRAKR